MSPTMLHTCLQGPLSEENHMEIRDDRACHLRLQQRVLGAKEPQPQSFPQDPPVNRLIRQLVSGMMFRTSHCHRRSDTKPLPGVTVLAERRGQRDREGGRERIRRQEEQDRGEERKNKENFPHRSASSLQDSFLSKDSILSIL